MSSHFLKLVYSVIASARQNKGFNETKLIIGKITVNERTVLKILKPRELEDKIL